MSATIRQMSRPPEVLAKAAWLRAIGTGLLIVGVSLLAISLYKPVLDAVHPGDDVSGLISHIRAVSNATIFYSEDHDHRLPLAVPKQGDRFVWRNGVEFPSETPPASDVWPNSVVPFLPPTERFYSTFTDPAYEPESLFTFNGLLHGHYRRRISYEELLVLIWTGVGKAAGKRRAYSNPTLMCDDATLQCRYGLVDAAAFISEEGTSVAGDNTLFMYADLHLRFRENDPFEFLVPTDASPPMPVAGNIAVPPMFKPDVTP